MLQVLNTKQTATATAVGAASHGLEEHGLEIASLRCSNAMISLESLMAQADAYVAKLEGFSQMHKLLSVMPNVSLESAALIEIVSNLLSHDTDLKGSTDLIPSLEAYTQGLEDEDKGSGFGETAKAVGNAVLETMKKIWAKLKETWALITDNVKTLKESFGKVKEDLEAKDLISAELELPVWAYNGLVDPMSSEVISYIRKAKAFDISINVAPGKESGEFYDEQLTKYLELLSDIAETKNDVILVTGIDSSEVLTYSVAKFENGRIVKGGDIDTDSRSKEELKKVKVTPEILRAGVISILRVLDDLESFVTESDAKVNKVADSFNMDDAVSVKVSLELLRIAGFSLSQIPKTILANYKVLHGNARKLVQAMEGSEG